MCCKGKGHSIEECPRDPNLKTGQCIRHEGERIETIKDVRTVFGETMTQTTQMLKRAIVVEGGKNQQSKRQTAFKRGIMEFEDFNYEPYNEYVLVRDKEKEDKIKAKRIREYEAERDYSPTMDHDDEHQDDELEGLSANSMEEDPLKGVPTVPGTSRQVAVLSEKTLDVLVDRDYSHKSM